MADEEVTPQVEEQVAEAAEAHEEADTTEGTPWSGEGNQPEGTGFAPPDTGAGEDAASEIPTGVDEIEPAADAGGDDGGNEPVDLANLDTGDDAPAAEAEAPEAEADAEPADAGAADEAEAPAAEAEPVDAGAADAEAPAAEEEEAAPAAEEEAAAPVAEGDDDEEEPVGDPDKFSAGGEVSVAGQGTQSGLEPGEAEKAGAVPTEFRVPPGVPAGLDPGTLEDRDDPPKPQS
jgi:hypothetical protein